MSQHSSRRADVFSQHQFYQHQLAKNVAGTVYQLMVRVPGKLGLMFDDRMMYDPDMPAGGRSIPSKITLTSQNDKPVVGGFRGAFCV
jgi:hypothetical protein